jgi:hypothetical protein
MDLHAIVLHVERDVGVEKKIVREILLYNVGLVATANDKII